MLVQDAKQDTCGVAAHTNLSTEVCISLTHTHTFRTARISAGMTDAARTVVCAVVKVHPEGWCRLTVHQESAVTQ